MRSGNYKSAREIVQRILTLKELPIRDFLSSKLLEVRILIRLGELEEANVTIQSVLPKAREFGDDLIIVDILLCQSELHWRFSDLDESIQILKEIKKFLDDIDENIYTKAEIDQRKEAYYRNGGIIDWYKGNLDKALEQFQQSLSILETLDDKQGIAITLNNLGLVYRSKGNIHEAIDYHKQSLTFIDTSSDDRIHASILNNLGVAYQTQGDHETALDYQLRSLAIKEKIGNKQDIALSMINLGVNCRMQGLLNQALEYYQQAQGIFEELGDKKNIALILNNLGDVYHLKGDLNLALEYNQESLFLYEELGLKEDIARSLVNIGEIYGQKNNSKWAEKYFLRGLKLFEDLNNNLSASIVVYDLLIQNLDSNNPDQAEKHLKKLQEIAEETKNRIVSQRLRIATALQLKTNARARSKMKAAEILEEIIREEISEYSLTITAMINLCDLLLFELKMTGEEDIINKVKDLTKYLLSIAEKQSSYSLFAETYVLQSKLALLGLDITKAQKLLEKALIIAEEKGLRNLAIKIYNDKASLESQIEEWQFLIKQKASLAERLELTRLEEMMSRVKGEPYEISEEEIKKYARYRERKVVKKWEEVPRRKYNLIHMDLLRNTSKTEKSNFRVAIAQLGLSTTNNIVNEFYEENSDGLFCIKSSKVEVIRKKMNELMETAHSLDIKVLLFPELSIDFNYMELFEDVTKFAKKNDMYVIPGSYHDQKTKRNICQVIGPEGVLWQQEKHIPAIIHYQGRRIKEGIETDTFTRNTLIARTEYGNIAITICRDFLDMDLRVELKNSDPPVDMIFNPAFTPVTADFQAAHFDARRSIYAYCFFSNIAEIGESSIYSPERENIERMIPPKEEKLIYKDVDLFRLRSERKKWELEQAKQRPFIQSTRL